ncbi:MAG: hypothetical protein JWN46_1293 [Acidimicrobiales bacterium]|nr:hypothetical protein [Acidimicrobiales bacterium]
MRPRGGRRTGGRRRGDGLTTPGLDRLLRPACALALSVARAGASARPAVPAPEGLGRVLGFARLSTPAYATIRHVVDDDDAFRERVAAVADEATLGRAGWLWLVRPEGWLEELADVAAATGPAVVEGPGERELARVRASLAAAEQRAQRHRDEARAARKAAESAEARRLDATRAQAALEARLEGTERRVEEAVEGRRVAIRALKGVEAELAEARRDLRVARTALIEAELQLAAFAERGAAAPAAAVQEPVDPSAAVSSAGRPIPPAAAAPVTAIELDDLRRAVEAASGAADDLARALGAAGAALRPVRSASADPDPARRVETAAEPDERGRGSWPRSRRTVRRPAALPAGRLEDSIEGAGHLFRLPGVVVLVDGYNVARTAWQGLTPEEERRRLVTALEGLHARTGADVIAVFDGAGTRTTVSPALSRTVKVRFSPAGVEADDVVRDMVVELPLERPVVVVSSDRAVADGARARGANVMSSARFLAAIGR